MNSSQVKPKPRPRRSLQNDIDIDKPIPSPRKGSMAPTIMEIDKEYNDENKDASTKSCESSTNQLPLGDCVQNSDIRSSVVKFRNNSEEAVIMPDETFSDITLLTSFTGVLPPPPFNSPERSFPPEMDSGNQEGICGPNNSPIKEEPDNPIKFRINASPRPPGVFACVVNDESFHELELMGDDVNVNNLHGVDLSRMNSPRYVDVKQEDVNDFEESSSETDVEQDSVWSGRIQSASEDSDMREKRSSARNKLLTPDRFVPLEYASSPIVELLATSKKDERPPLPRPFSTSTITEIPIEREVGLLEKIIRSHPIWYLQHMGRSAATHILRKMDTGIFIVRASSRPGAMALSLKIPEGYSIDVDHYIIEKTRDGQMKLESSPYSFRSLPELLSHYCKVSEELQTRLRLPTAIKACNTTAALQSLALMGQDFWSSNMATSDGFVLHRTSSQYGDFERRNSQYEMPNKKRPTSRASRQTDRRFATIHGDLCKSPSLIQGPLSDKETPSPPSKHERVSIIDSPSHSRNVECRSSSVRSNKVVVPPSPSLSTSSRDGNRRSFLRSLFSFGSDKSSSSTVNQLAQCHYFVPHSPKQKVKSSRSAFELERNNTEEWYRAQERSMRTFKTQEVSPRGKSSCSSSTSSSCVSVPMRRERSDLSSTSVGRLARHLEGSPGPPAMQSPRNERVPLKPPQNGLDASAMRNCVEELRRKRLQTADEMLRPSSGIQKGSTSHHVSLRPRIMGGSWRGPPKEQRLSAPNLVDQQVLHSAKALKEKIGRNVDGELSTINEGLVTPVVRRKNFPPITPSVENTKENGKGECPPSGTVSRGREALEAIFDGKKLGGEGLGRRYHSERSRSRPPAPLDGFWKSQKESSSLPSGPAGDSISASHLVQQPQFFPQKSGSSWSAITGELKCRQKIAKVRPTPQARSMMTIKGSPSNTGPTSLNSPHSGAHSRSSDYAQLSDLSTGLPRESNTSLLNVKDDDAVSVAGTVFNEPWDSNVWENLLDLAHHGDEKPAGIRLNDTITEEDDGDSDHTGSSMMHDSEDEEDVYGSRYGTAKRKIPSDHVIVKAWDSANESHSRFSTIDSRMDSSISGSLRRGVQTHGGSPQNSMHSLPRAVSRFSECQVGSLDDLPTQLPTMSPLLSQIRQKRLEGTEPGQSIQKYVEKLSEDDATVFGATLRRFVECTVESEECDPQVVVRNVRQFLNGIKNYLVKHGEGELHQMIESESSRLNANQILNIDALLEAVLHKVLLRPIKPHLYHLMVKEHSKTGSLQSLSANLGFVRALSLKDLGFPNADQITTPSSSQMDLIKVCLRKMQHHYSPLKKLENLLRAVSLVLSPGSDENTLPLGTLKKSMNHVVPPADELVRWLVYILARTSTVGCEVEAWYMWELLPQQMLTQGDAAYYLTALFSAVHVLKSTDAIRKLAENDHGMMSSMDLSRACVSSTSTSSCAEAFVKVAIPDEENGSIRYCTFPGVPQMTAGKLCRVVAHQQGITNPEDHGLYLLVDGYETCLLPTESPDAIRDQLRSANKPYLFAYKRHEAKIAWPKQAMNQSPQMGSQVAV